MGSIVWCAGRVSAVVALGGIGAGECARVCVCVCVFVCVSAAVAGRLREREIYIDNLLVRVHVIIEMSRPALRRGSLNFLYQVALYLPS